MTPPAPVVSRKGGGEGEREKAGVKGGGGKGALDKCASLMGLQGGQRTRTSGRGS